MVGASIEDIAANAITGDVRSVQVQQGANGDKQQESLQRGEQLIKEIFSKQRCLKLGRFECNMFMEAANVDKDAKYLVHTQCSLERVRKNF